MKITVKKFWKALIPKKIWKRLFRSSLQLVPADYRARLGYSSMWWSIENIKKLGYAPNTIIDVGAYEGVWTQNVMEIFPEANFLMVEAQPDKKKVLSSLADKNPQLHLDSNLAGSVDGEEKGFVVMRTGSSVYEQLHETKKDRKFITLKTKTLDSSIKERKLSGNYFIKLDVQGYEIEVLKGAKEVLKNTDVILLEASLLNYNEGAPLVDEVIHYLKGVGFLLFDICEFNRKSEDNVLNQVDLIFCKKDWPIRQKANFKRK